MSFYGSQFLLWEGTAASFRFPTSDQVHKELGTMADARDAAKKKKAAEKKGGKAPAAKAAAPPAPAAKAPAKPTKK
jgi:hypothetical protein